MPTIHAPLRFGILSLTAASLIASPASAQSFDPRIDDGAIVLRGANVSALPSALREVVALGASWYTTQTIRTDGGLAVWGYNSKDLAKPPPPTLGTTYVALSQARC